MAFSGTVSETVFTTRKLIEHACRRCKLRPQQLAAEDLQEALDSLYLLLSSFALKGAPLWTYERTIMPLYDGQANITLPLGTIDLTVLPNLRTVSTPSGTEVQAATTYTISYGTDVAIGTVQIIWAGDAVPIAIERNIDGVWLTVQEETPATGTTLGDCTWFDLTSTLDATDYRIRATSGTLDVGVVRFGNNFSEIPVARLNQQQFTTMPNKDFKSAQPLQFWMDHQVPRPILRLWPMPNDAAAAKALIVWRTRQIMDVGTLTQEIEVPQRWYDAVVAGLAGKIAIENPDVKPELIPILKGEAKSALAEAFDDNRDKSPIYIAPNIGMYTR